MMASSFLIHISYYTGAIGGKKRRLVSVTDGMEIEVAKHPNWEGRRNSPMVQ